MAFETLTRTPSVAGNRRTFTISQWVKFNVAGLNQKFYSTAAGAGTSAASFFWMIENAGNLDCGSYYSASGGWQNYVQTSPLLRDYSAWYHVVCAVDTTQATASNRIKVYVNNVLQPLTASAYPVQNFQYDVNNTTTQYIGSAGAAGSDPKSEWCNTNMSDFYLIDGLALDSSYFGKVDTRKNNQWVAKHPTVINNAIIAAGGFGTNGFYLPLGTPYINGSSDVQNLGNAKLIMGCTGGNTTTFDVNTISATTVGTLTYNATGGAINNGPYATGFTMPTSVNSTSGAVGWMTGDSSVFTSWTTGRTWAAWVKTSDTGTRSGNSWQVKVPVFGDYRNSVYGAFGIDNSKIAFGNASIYTGTSNIADGTWHHIALTCSNGTKSSAIFKMYVDGKYEATVPASILDQVSLDSLRLDCVGFHYMYTSVASPTALDGVQVYYYEMSNDQINALYRGTTYTVGYDYSGNNAHWTSSGSLQVVKDSITNNYATMNPISGFDGAHTMGGLVQTGMNDCLATMGFKTGKFYWEHKILQYAGAGNVLHFGVKNGDTNASVSQAINGPGIHYRNDGQITRIAGNSCSAWSGSDVTAGSGVSTAVNDVIGVAVDLTSSPASVIFYKNNVAMHSYTFTYTQTAHYMIPFVRNNSGCSSEQNFGQGTFVTSNNGNGYADVNGKGKFQYAPPTGFLALCEDNLTDIAFNPVNGFKPILYTGNGASTQAITGVGFRPDFVWIAPLDDATSWQTLEDANRGAGYYIAPNNNVAEQSTGVLLSSFDADGFTVNYTPNGTTNTSGKHYVAWCWKAGDANVTNTSGSVTTTVRANNTTGFSIVTYSGTNAATGTIGTGLNGTSMFTFYKGRNNTSDWWTYFGEDDHTRGQMNGTGALYTDGNNAFKHAGLNGQIAFTAGNTDSNLTGINYIVYTWKQVPGFSAAGYYTGNGSANGPSVYLGFKPAWVLIRSRTTARDWIVYDSARGGLYNPNSGGAKAITVSNTYTGSPGYSTAIDFLSNGFKLRDGTSPNYNGSGETYEYVAFAEQSFDFANAK